MFEKVRPTAHGGNGNGSTSEPIVGLSGDRLALVHRYMVDAEEAEALAQAAADRDEQREAAERVRIRPRLEAAPFAAEETPQRARVTVTNPRPHVVGPAGNGNGRTYPREDAQAPKALVKADKLTAKQAAKRMAALEKKEARERKALAKAATRGRVT